MRFLHLADVHLDTPFAERSDELRRRLRDASREALRRAGTLALDEEVHAVVLAGDLFDGERVSFATERFLLEEMKRLTEAGIRVIYATGNHDPGRLGGRARSLEWPEGMTVVDGPEPVRVEVEDGDGRLVGRVTAAGHESPREARDLASRFPAPRGDVPEVALLHALVVGARRAEAHDRYAPARLRTLERSRFDYWALGHVHLRQRVSATPPAWYPGNLQGRNPRETGPKGALLVELEAGGAASVRFRALAPVRWERLEVGALDAVTTLDGLVRRIGRAWEAARDDDPGLPGCEWILRVALRGPSPLHRELGLDEDRRALEEDLAGRLGLLRAEVRVEGVYAPVRPDEHRERQDVLGETLRLLRELAEDDRTLRKLAPRELAGAPENPTAYLRSLLDGLDAEIADRMLAEPGPEGG